MNKTQQRIKIAEACGWKLNSDWQRPGIGKWWEHEEAIGSPKRFDSLPDYLNDLNVMHSSWKEHFGFYSEEWLHAHSHLKQIVSCSLGEDDMDDPYVVAAIANATAEQRAEAFLRTLGLWET